MRHAIAAVAGATLLLAAAGQATAQEDMAEADEAAREMMMRTHVYEVGAWRMPSEVVARLRELGYTGIDDFDVEYGEYEVEAQTPDGEAVEIEINPVTGAIMDIDENWF
jgi:hypothetical protein